MNAKEFVQIVKKMFSKGLTPEEKIKLADEGPVCRNTKATVTCMKTCTIQ